MHMHSVKAFQLTMLGMGLALIAACGSSGPSSSGAGVTVNSIRSRAEARFRQFLTQPGVGTIAIHSSTTSSLGQQLEGAATITFWRSGNNYRAEITTPGNGTDQVVLNGQTVRANLNSLSTTKDVFLDRLKSGNRPKI